MAELSRSMMGRVERMARRDEEMTRGTKAVTATSVVRIII